MFSFCDSHNQKTQILYMYEVSEGVRDRREKIKAERVNICTQTHPPTHPRTIHEKSSNRVRNKSETLLQTAKSARILHEKRPNARALTLQSHRIEREETIRQLNQKQNSNRAHTTTTTTNLCEQRYAKCIQFGCATLSSRHGVHIIIVLVLSQFLCMRVVRVNIYSHTSK